LVGCDENLNCPRAHTMNPCCTALSIKKAIIVILSLSLSPSLPPLLSAGCNLPQQQI